MRIGGKLSLPASPLEGRRVSQSEAGGRRDYSTRQIRERQRGGAKWLGETQSERRAERQGVDQSERRGRQRGRCGLGASEPRPGPAPGPAASAAAMNILPKKSWHVRNKDNVARVRRDEAAAEVERRKRDARALRAEQEVRTELLRKRARVGGRSPSPPAPPVLFPPPEEAPNREHEAEKRREQERRERALGVLTYLGQSAAEAQTCPPWYLQAPKKAGEGSREVQGGRKAVLDPLQDMRKGLHRAPSPKKSPQPQPRSPPRAPPEKGGGGGGLAELRRQRLAREAAEAERSRELLRGLRDPPGTPRNRRDPPDPERQRPYNSQFHPRLARGGTRRK